MQKQGKLNKLLNQPHEYGMPAGSLMSNSTGASAESQTLRSRPDEISRQGSLQEQGWLEILELDIVPFVDEIHQHLGDRKNNDYHKYNKLHTQTVFMSCHFSTALISFRFFLFTCSTLAVVSKNK